MKPRTAILAEVMTEPNGFLAVTEYSPTSASEQESISSVHCPFAREVVKRLAFVSIGLLSFCQAASTGSAAAFIAAVSSSRLPTTTVASFNGAKKTGGAAAIRLKY